jgi:DNA polymerase III gamma/tau subunit
MTENSSPGDGLSAGAGAGVFGDLVGQDAVVEELRGAAAAAAAVLRGEPNTGMTHAWLFTGPPGSGRSVAARAFAAALLCPYGGCGSARPAIRSAPERMPTCC